ISTSSEQTGPTSRPTDRRTVDYTSIIIANAICYLLMRCYSPHSNSKTQFS
ncbi:unnamed protein product, partial [Ceratitis capitata]